MEYSPDPVLVERAVKWLLEAERPVIIAGYEPVRTSARKSSGGWRVFKCPPHCLGHVSEDDPFPHTLHYVQIQSHPAHRYRNHRQY